MAKGINGIILAGGESVRMGTDKSLISFHGKPQREFVFDLLSKFCDEVFLSCKKADAIPAHLNPLPDKFEFKSPMNGVLSAFEHRPDTAWLSMPVDMPNIDERIIQHLLEHRNLHKVATCFYDSDGQYPEPLFTIWEAKAYKLLKQFYSKGKIQPRNFLMTHDVEVLKSPDAGMHININTRSDWDKFAAGNRTSGEN